MQNGVKCMKLFLLNTIELSIQYCFLIKPDFLPCRIWKCVACSRFLLILIIILRLIIFYSKFLSWSEEIDFQTLKYNFYLTPRFLIDAKYEKNKTGKTATSNYKTWIIGILNTDSGMIRIFINYEWSLMKNCYYESNSIHTLLWRPRVRRVKSESNH